MKHERIIKELSKLGIEAEKKSYHRSLYVAHGNRYRLEWFKEEDEVSFVKCIPIKENSEIYKDYFPGFFVDTYKNIKIYLL